MGFIERTVTRLYPGYTISGINCALIQSPDLLAHFFGNGESCRVICSAVDSISGRELFCGLCFFGHVYFILSVGIHGKQIILYGYVHTQCSSLIFRLPVAACFPAFYVDKILKILYFKYTKSISKKKNIFLVIMP